MKRFLLISFFFLISMTNTLNAEDIDIQPKDSTQDEISRIDSIIDNQQKIKEWAKFNSTGNYLVINKKNCLATVYDKDGNEIKRFEIGIGKEIGDDYNDTKGLMGKAKNTTPAGEFTIVSNFFNKSAYGDITLSLGGKASKVKETDKVVALHKIPKFRLKERKNKFNDGNLSNNRMSHGCINFIEKDFNELIKYLKEGQKVYVLPEEKDNQLKLGKNENGKFELMQTKY